MLHKYKIIVLFSMCNDFNLLFCDKNDLNTLKMVICMQWDKDSGRFYVDFLQI